MTRRPLQIVSRDEAPTEREVVDIYAAIKAKRESIDWAAMHIAADRRKPVELPEIRKGWRA